MAKKHQEEAKGGLPGWMGTYGDLVTLLLCFYVLLFAMSSIDVSKYKAAISSFNDQVDIMPGGIALTGEELITNGVSQLSEINVILRDNNLQSDVDNKKGEGESEQQTTESSSDTTETTTMDPNAVIIGSDGEPKSETEAIADNIEQALTDNLLEYNVTVTFEDNYAKIELDGEALFDSGKADIKPEAEGLLEVIAGVIVENGYDQYLMEIEGHTDNIPMNTVQYPNNWYLSSARAISVGSVFINQFGFNPELVACTGYGEYKPIADNSTPEGRAQNRRVEIKIIVENPDQLVESN